MNEPNVNDINLTIKGFDFLNEEDSEVCWIQYNMSIQSFDFLMKRTQRFVIL
jgi:hypothetical protein